MNRLFAIAARFTTGKPQPPERNPAYKKFVTTFPCVGCGEFRRRRDPNHLGPRGLSQTASDMDALPFCRKCHNKYHASVKAFYRDFGYERVRELQAYFRGMWAAKQEKRAA